jgi:hypothetical protein
MKLFIFHFFFSIFLGRENVMESIDPVISPNNFIAVTFSHHHHIEGSGDRTLEAFRVRGRVGDDQAGGRSGGL